MSYLYLAIAIACEVIATSALKASQGFTVPIPSIITVVGYAVAFYLLSLTLKTIPIGIAYAIWSGAGYYFNFCNWLDILQTAFRLGCLHWFSFNDCRHCDY